MDLLKKQNWWAWLLFALATTNISVFFLGALLNVYDKNAWYAKWYFWVIGVFALVLPALIMFFIFYMQILTSVCRKLDVPGKEVYSYPYVFILCIIVPIIGWALFIIIFIYLNIWYLVKLYQGKGEKYVK